MTPKPRPPPNHCTATPTAITEIPRVAIPKERRHQTPGSMISFFVSPQRWPIIKLHTIVSALAHPGLTSETDQQQLIQLHNNRCCRCSTWVTAPSGKSRPLDGSEVQMSPSSLGPSPAMFLVTDQQPPRLQHDQMCVPGSCPRSLPALSL